MSTAAAAFSAHASEYDGLRRRLVPDFDGFYGALIDFLAAECRKHGIENPSTEDIRHHGVEVIKEKYGNLFDMYAKITGEDP